METHAAPWRNRIVGHGVEPTAALVANPRNWRTHPKAQQQALAAVLDDVGWVQDVIVNRTTGNLVDGHLRVELARQRGEASVPVVYVELSEQGEALVLATLDPLGAMAGADAAVLQDLLTSVHSADADVQSLLAAIARDAGAVLDEPAAGGTDPDDAPPLALEAVSRGGDLWRLGPHRALCGDATKSDDVGRLFGGERAQWMWSDPPFGVSYMGGTADRLTLENDSAGAVPALLRDAFALADNVLADGAPLYVAHPAGPLSVTFGQAFLDAGWRFHQGLIWVKDAFVLGHCDHHYRHEGILYGWKGTGRPWFGGRDQESVFFIDRPRRSTDHPTAKPVALVEAHLRNSSWRGALGYDPFAGSGTTLIAAHRLGRRCAAMELDPRYVDVIVRRWQGHTGEAAVLDDDGRSFAQVEEVRRGR